MSPTTSRNSESIFSSNDYAIQRIQGCSKASKQDLNASQDDVLIQRNDNALFRERIISNSSNRVAFQPLRNHKRCLVEHSLSKVDKQQFGQLGNKVVRQISILCSRHLLLIFFVFIASSLYSLQLILYANHSFIVASINPLPDYHSSNSSLQRAAQVHQG